MSQVEDEEHKKNIAIEALEIVYHQLRLWYQDLDGKTDVILERDIGTFSDQELEVFYNLNDLSLDVGGVLPNVLHTLNISITTSDTGGTPY